MSKRAGRSLKAELDSELSQLEKNQGKIAYHSFCDRTLLTFGCRLGSQGGPGRASWGSCALECSVYSSQQTAVCCVYIVLASVDQLGLTQVESSLDC